MRPRKRFGQHWLRSEAVLQRIIEGAELQATDRILEIGPGQGVLTRSLVAQVQQVIAVEIDRDLCQALRKQFAADDKFRLIQGDILSLFKEARAHTGVFWEAGGLNCNKVVANIPYNITGPILETLLGSIAIPHEPPYDSIVLLVQHEVAQRLCAQPGTKACGALTQRVRYRAACEILCEVPRKAFSPPPQVESAVIRLRPRPFETSAQDPRHLQRLIAQGFQAKRKMLRNNLKGMIPSDRLETHFEWHNIAPTARAEDLSLEQWVNLSNTLFQEYSPQKLPPN